MSEWFSIGDWKTMADARTRCRQMKDPWFHRELKRLMVHVRVSHCRWSRCPEESVTVLWMPWLERSVGRSITRRQWMKCICRAKSRRLGLTNESFISSHLMRQSTMTAQQSHVKANTFVHHHQNQHQHAVNNWIRVQVALQSNLQTHRRGDWSRLLK